MLNLRPPRAQRSSLASLDAYRAAEAARAAGKAGAAAGADADAAPAPPSGRPALTTSASFDVEYEALALRVAPPEVHVDNRARPDTTLVTIDSANRAGTLLAVAQFLTEQRLNVKSARITSDFGWFYDVFEVTEADGGKVTDERKLDDIRRMLDVDVDTGSDVALNSDETDDARRVETTVVQLAGPDRPGLLADVTALLAGSGCDVRSAAVWTSDGRVAAVLAVTEKGRPVTDGGKLARLADLLDGVVNAEGGGDGEGADGDAAPAPPTPRSARRGAVSIDRVRGEVHHDRRLHRLLLEEAAAAWAEGRAEGGGGGDRRAAAGAPGSSPSTDSAASSLDGPGPTPLDAGLRGTLYDDDDEPAASPPPPADDDDDGATASGSDDYVSPCATRPAVKVSHDPRAAYWVVTTACRDRPKLLFDTLCTLADLDYDVFHAAVDAAPGGAATQEFFVRPRHGVPDFDADRADQLAALVGASIVRRFPRGLKVHVRSLDRYGCLASLTAVLRASGLTVTRAKVRTFAAAGGDPAAPGTPPAPPGTPGAGGGSGHTFYVMGAGGAPPDRAAVEAACAAAGGRLVDAAGVSVGGGGASAGAHHHLASSAPACDASGGAAFSYSFLSRRWTGGWRGSGPRATGAGGGAGGGVGASGASPGSDASSF